MLQGRDRAIQEIAQALEDHQVVTVFGLPGVGKTRLAHQCLAPGQREEALWTDLQGTRTALQVWEKMHRTLRLPDAQGEPLEAQIQSALEVLPTGSVWVLDDANVFTAHQLLECLRVWCRRAPHVQWLLTSHVRIPLPSAHPISLGPLEPEDAQACFEAYALRADPSFVLTPPQQPMLRALLERLDRLPLAIELMAAHTRHFDIPTLFELLEERFVWLERRDAGSTRSLYQSIQTLWTLLCAAERELLLWWVVWERPWTLEMLCGVLEASRPDTLRRVDALLQKSFLSSASHPHTSLTFDMAESVRDFVRVQFSQEQREASTRRLLDWILSKAQELSEQRMRQPGPESYLELMAYEELWWWAWDQGALTQGEAALGLALAQRAVLLSRVSEARYRGVYDRLEEFLNSVDAPLLEAHVCVTLGYLAETVQGEEALRWWKRGMGALDADRHPRPWALVTLELLLEHLLRGELAPATEHMRALVAHATRHPEPYVLSMMHLGRGHVLMAQSSHEQAAEELMLSYRLCREHLCSQRCVLPLWTVAFLHQNHMEHERTLVALQTCYQIARELQNQNDIISLLGSMTHTNLQMGRWSEALDVIDRALECARQQHSHTFHCFYWIGRATVYLEREELSASIQAYERAGQYALEPISNAFSYHLFGAQLSWVRGDLERAHMLYERVLEQLPPVILGEDEPWIHGTLWVLKGLLGRATPPDHQERARALLHEMRQHPKAFMQQRAQVLEAWFHYVTWERGNLQGRRVRPERLEALLSNLPTHQDCQTPDSPRFPQDLNLRIVLRLLHERWAQDTSQAPTERAPTLTIGPQALWFRLDQGERVDLRRRGPMRQIIWTLAQRRLTHPGQSLSVYDLFEAAWDEPMRNPEQDVRRVYNNISRLRRMGLEEIVWKVEEGYHIPATVEVHVEGSR